MRVTFAILFALYALVSTLDYNDQVGYEQDFQAITSADQAQAASGVVPCDTDQECEERNPQLAEKWEE